MPAPRHPQLLIQAFVGLLRTNGRRLTVLDDTGAQFDALMTVGSAVETEFELGVDPREMTLANAFSSDLADQLPPDLLSAPDSIKFGVIVNDGAQDWKIVKRHDNSSDFTVQFWLKQMTNQDG